MSITAAPEGAAARARSTNHRMLDESARHRVTDLLCERDFRCRCGCRDFAVGDALEMGSIWPDEPLGTYLVALTCLDCATRDGMRVHVDELAGLAPGEPV